jgi:hypothetical protein
MCYDYFAVAICSVCFYNVLSVITALDGVCIGNGIQDWWTWNRHNNKHQINILIDITTARFQVVTPTLLKIPVYWDVDNMPTAKYCSIYRGIVFLASLVITTFLELFEHEDGVTTKSREVITQRHRVTSQKKWILSFAILVCRGPDASSLPPVPIILLVYLKIVFP